jgi:hypothetical protein
MSNEPWRQAAYDLLPTFRDRVEAAEDVGMLWIELWDCEVAGSAAQITETEISSLFSYASGVFCPAMKSARTQRLLISMKCCQQMRVERLGGSDAIRTHDLCVAN